MLDNAFGEIFRHGRLMIEVASNIIAVFGFFVKIRVFTRGVSPTIAVCVVHPHTYAWCTPESVIDSQIQNHSNTILVEGINQLYEFDCGELSGWMYSVNSWFPNYGCSQYEVSDGDMIEWRYTCDLGRDVGDQYYE